MNQIGRDERLENWNARSGGACARRAAAWTLRGLLAFAALCGSPAKSEPPARQVNSPALAQADVPALKSDYLRSDRASSQHRLPPEAAAHCSTIGEELLKREFDGGFDRLLAWWQVARQAPLPE